MGSDRNVRIGTVPLPARLGLSGRLFLARNVVAIRKEREVKNCDLAGSRKFLTTPKNVSLKRDGRKKAVEV